MWLEFLLIGSEEVEEEKKITNVKVIPFIGWQWINLSGAMWVTQLITLPKDIRVVLISLLSPTI